MFSEYEDTLLISHLIVAFGLVLVFDKLDYSHIFKIRPLPPAHFLHQQPPVAY